MKLKQTIPEFSTLDLNLTLSPEEVGSTSSGGILSKPVWFLSMESGTGCLITTHTLALWWMNLHSSSSGCDAL
jgi:hypothetical protein